MYILTESNETSWKLRSSHSVLTLSTDSDLGKLKSAIAMSNGRNTKIGELEQEYFGGFTDYKNYADASINIQEITAPASAISFNPGTRRFNNVEEVITAYKDHICPANERSSIQLKHITDCGNQQHKQNQMLKIFGKKFAIDNERAERLLNERDPQRRVDNAMREKVRKMRGE